MSTKFIQELARTLKENWLRDITLISPSQRIGLQWLDNVCKINKYWANVKITTITRLAFDLADEEIKKNNYKIIDDLHQQYLIANIFNNIKYNSSSKKYFTKLLPSILLIKRLSLSIKQLRMSDISSKNLFTSNIQPPHKAEEIANILEKYEKYLQDNQAVDQADAFRLAISSLDNADQQPLFLLSTEEEVLLSGLEKQLWQSFKNKQALNIDTHCVNRDIEVFSALSESCEVDNVFRKILQDKIPLDKVEVITSSNNVYLPIIINSLKSSFSGSVENLPFTASEGIPLYYARAAKLILRCCEWISSNYPQNLLAEIITSRLFKQNLFTNDLISPEILAEFILILPIGQGIERYKLSKNCLNHWLKHSSLPIQQLIDSYLELLEKFIIPLENILSQPKTTLEILKNIIENQAIAVGELENYASKVLIDSINQQLNIGCWQDFDGLEWIKNLINNSTVLGQSPLPGKLFITDFNCGGHSGREYTFILGLNEDKITGSAQDPILLDSDRLLLSNELSTSIESTQAKQAHFKQLLARLHCHIFLSYPTLDSSNMQELLPSNLILEYNSHKRNIFSLPTKKQPTLNKEEDWLVELIPLLSSNIKAESLKEYFPNLYQGEIAKIARQSSEFTIYDGYVQEAGIDFSKSETEQPLSNEQIKVFATCPLEYFFCYRLGIKAPEYYENRKASWLNSLLFGELLHETFYHLLTALNQLNQLPDRIEHWSEGAKIVNDLLHKYREKITPNSAFGFTKQKKSLFTASNILINLQRNQERFSNSQSSCLEVAMGMDNSYTITSFDQKQPTRIILPQGDAIFLKGKIDRVEVNQDYTLSIYDYKTSKETNYKTDPTFNAGRQLQPVIYYLMLAEVIKQKVMSTSIYEFSYIFPLDRSEGNIITYSNEVLKEGIFTLEKIVNLLKNGCFPFTTQKEDLKYSSYLEVYFNPEKMLYEAQKKQANSSNFILEPWRKLRAKKEEN